FADSFGSAPCACAARVDWRPPPIRSGAAVGSARHRRPAQVERQPAVILPSAGTVTIGIRASRCAVRVRSSCGGHSPNRVYASLFENLEQWNPIHSSGFQRYRGYPTLLEPIGYALQIFGEGCKYPHGILVPSWRYVHKHLSCSNV